MASTVAYIANTFPSAVEWYVQAEIQELRRRDVRVIPCSTRRSIPSALSVEERALAGQTVYLERFDIRALLRMLRNLPATLPRVADLIFRVLGEGSERPMRRLRAMLHTLAGLYFATILEGQHVEHIHVHHG